VQLPIRPADAVSGHWFIFTASANFESGVERSGVFGPLICGSRVERSIVMTSSYWAPSSARSKFDNEDVEAIV